MTQTIKTTTYPSGHKNENKIKQEMSKYQAHQLDLYMAEAGWQDWMDAYTESPDGIEATEAEIKEIESMQKELWEEAHGEV